MPVLLCGPLAVRAQPAGLPELGDSSAAELSPRIERRLGDALMANGLRDPTYINDAAISQYLTEMGRRLAAHATGTPEVNVFGVRDASINAFAMPGGHIGIHSGLVVAAQTESELAGVLAHEIGHVTQRHVARQIGQQSQSSLLMLGMMMAALAAAAAGAGDLAQGAAVFGQAAAVNSQLAFSRDAEREADRVGLQMLQAAGYDPAGMAGMFARLMQTSRFNQGGGVSYASTHPMSIERMSDMQNRQRGLAPASSASSPSFWFVRAKLTVLQSGHSRVIDPLSILRNEAATQKGVRAAAALYGVATGLLAQNRVPEAEQAWQQAMALGVEHPMLAALGVELAIAAGRLAEATDRGGKAVAIWPRDRALTLTHARGLQRAGRDEDALAVLQAAIERSPAQEPAMYRLAAESSTRLGRAVAGHRYMAEFYMLTGAAPSALSQLQQARTASRDFHEQSVLDARIVEVQRRITDDRALMKQFS